MPQEGRNCRQMLFDNRPAVSPTTATVDCEKPPIAASTAIVQAMVVRPRARHRTTGSATHLARPDQLYIAIGRPRNIGYSPRGPGQQVSGALRVADHQTDCYCTAVALVIAVGSSLRRRFSAQRQLYAERALQGRRHRSGRRSGQDFAPGDRLQCRHLHGPRHDARRRHFRRAGRVQVPQRAADGQLELHAEAGSRPSTSSIATATTRRSCIPARTERVPLPSAGAPCYRSSQ